MLPIFENLTELWRWLHVLFGIVWIGMLYYFNFVQTEYFKEAEAGAKSDALQKLAPRALWWFRWGAAFTFLTGLLLLHAILDRWNVYILFGSLLGTLMAANVWFVIWPNQKVVIAAASGDTSADPAPALARAGCASRHNTLFSVPMLLFMVSSAHLGGSGAELFTQNLVSSLVGVALIVALEVNALCGKPDYVKIVSVRQVIIMGFVLSAVLAAVAEFL